jgi:hypothetical protein
MRVGLALSVCACAAALASSFLPVPAAEPAAVTVRVTAEAVDFAVAGGLVGRYHKGDVAKPYFWPLNDSVGRPVTRGWPMEPAPADGSKDHIHQKSAWFCHGDVIPEGLSLKSREHGVDGVDFWSEGKGHGRIICTRVDEPRLDGSHATLATHNKWRTEEGDLVLDEERVIHLYDLGETRLFVFDIDLCASAVPVTFGDTKEGSFGVRVNDAIREAGGKGRLENADGQIGEGRCWGRQSAWCDYSGPICGRTVGVAILDDPKNPSPACWHSRGYGLMAANPFGRAKSGFSAMRGRTDLVKLGKGEHLRLRYGLLIHPGNAREGKVAEYYERFVRLKG